MLRPGFYAINFLPDKSQMKTGYNSGTNMRHAALQKHKAIIDNLTLMRSTDIKDLNDFLTHNGEKWSLRKFVLGLREDLTATTGSKYLFHSIDFADSGADKEACVVYATAFTDRAEKAEAALNVLPAIVNYKFNRDIAKKWFHPGPLQEIDDTELKFDTAGNWTGDWRSPDDVVNEQILDEDLGFTVVLEGLDLIVGSNI